ncbi:protein-disulfide isomerase [Streptomyces sp. 846.5]|nr:thioredoxin domain-containing protein [Streptomyces sp. 846.5]TDT95739.1 protein-disulfide isomerase [Streptomyces sp. 846.5]
MAASTRARVTRAAVAAVALAVAVGGEASVGRALSDGGRQRFVAEQTGYDRSSDALTLTVSRSVHRPALIADVPQRKILSGLPARLAPDGAGIDVGYADAPVVLTLFEDFRCSSTRDFERRQGAELAGLAARHQVLLRYVMESSLDQRLPGPGGLLATNAARAALSRGAFPLFHALLFANQPDEYVDGFTVPRLLAIAGSVPHLRGPAFDTEVRTVWYRDWVNAAQTAYDDAHVRFGTPSMLLNGNEVDLGAQHALLSDPKALGAFVAQAAAQKAAAEQY